MIEIIKHGTKHKINHHKKNPIKKKTMDCPQCDHEIIFLMKLLFNESSD